MKTYKKLIIYLGNYSLNDFISHLNKRIIPPWQIADQIEGDLIDTILYYQYDFQGNENLPQARLFLAQYEEDSILKAINILADEISHLSYDDYNGILTNFYEKLVKPCAAEHKVNIEITRDEITAKDLLTNKNEQLFYQFSKTANRSTGTIHPMDQAKWFNFIISVHQNQEKSPEPDDIENLLIEDGWPVDTAIKLSSEYHSSLDLLNTYDNQKAYG